MGKVIVGMTMALDGYINDRNGSVGMLYPDLATLAATDVMQEAIRATGAVVMGWNTFAMASDPDLYAGNYEFQVPIFVVTQAAPERRPRETDQLTFTFVTKGVAVALEQAKAAAQTKDVMVVGGARTVWECLATGAVDELHIDIMPVLLGGGRRLFEALGAEQIRLERIAAIELPAGRTHLRFRVIP
jgi:dihydrofolate reductase